MRILRRFWLNSETILTQFWVRRFWCNTDAIFLFYFSHLSFYSRGKVCPHLAAGLQPGLVPAVRPSLQRCCSTLLLVGQFKIYIFLILIFCSDSLLLLVGQFKKGFSLKNFIFCFRSLLLLVGEFETDFLCFHFSFGYQFQFHFLKFFWCASLGFFWFF